MEPIVIKGAPRALSPLTFAALKAQRDNIKALAQGGFSDGESLFAAMASVVHASLARQSPDLTLEEVEAVLDWPAAERMVNEVLVLSFPQAPAGETPAASPSGASTLMPSSSS